MPETFLTHRRVAFRDTDAAGMVHFSVFFTYLEDAEHELLRRLGLSVHSADADSPLRWPRVSARCDFRSPARFEDELTIELTVERLGAKSVTYRGRVLREGELLAEGSATAACCRPRADGSLEAVAIPEPVAAQLRPYLLPAP